MKSRVTASFRRAYAELPYETQRAAKRAFRRFSHNPRHPSLQLKRVHATLPIVSARVSDEYRVLGLLHGDEITWYWIGPHREYDKRLRRL